ncbi:MAG: hypothetical protein U0904_10010 [Candidatus Nanopelagicales bacterium]|nr:hypothetical protein [Candidatus Nanopelagicales bacterium]
MPRKYGPELRAKAVPLVRDHREDRARVGTDVVFRSMFRSTDVKTAAARLVHFLGSDGWEGLAELRRSGAPRVAAAAFLATGLSAGVHPGLHGREAEVVSAIRGGFSHRSWRVRRASVWAANEFPVNVWMKPPGAGDLECPVDVELLRDADRRVRDAALGSLCFLDADSECAPELVQAFRDGDRRTKERCLHSLALESSERPVRWETDLAELRAVLGDPEFSQAAKGDAAAALAARGDAGMAAVIMSALNDPYVATEWVDAAEVLPQDSFVAEELNALARRGWAGWDRDTWGRTNALCLALEQHGVEFPNVPWRPEWRDVTPVGQDHEHVVVPPLDYVAAVWDPSDRPQRRALRRHVERRCWLVPLWLGSDDETLRAAAVVAAGLSDSAPVGGWKPVVTEFEQLASSDACLARTAVARASASLPIHDAGATRVRLVGDDCPFVRCSLAETIGRGHTLVGDEALIDALLGDKEDGIREQAALAAGRLERVGSTVSSRLVGIAQSEPDASPRVRAAACLALAAHGHLDVTQVIRDGLDSPYAPAALILAARTMPDGSFAAPLARLGEIGWPDGDKSSVAREVTEAAEAVELAARH